jgi:hypothetical protein
MSEMKYLHKYRVSDPLLARYGDLFLCERTLKASTEIINEWLKNKFPDQYQEARPQLTYIGPRSAVFKLKTPIRRPDGSLLKTLDLELMGTYPIMLF